jgi:hypothetical protein
MAAPDQPKQLTAADFEPWGLWAAIPHCPWCGKRNCVAPAMSKYGTVVNVCHRCHSQWEAPK